MRSSWLVLLPIVIFAAPRTAQSQPAAAVGSPAVRLNDSLPLESLASGMRVRLGTAAPPFWQIGTLFSIPSDTIVFRVGRTAGLLRLPMNQLTSLSVADGREITGSRLVSAAVVGMLFGAVLTRAKQMHDDAEGCRECAQDRGIVRGMALGTAAGVLVAIAKPGERWRPVRFSSTPRPNAP